MPSLFSSEKETTLTITLNSRFRLELSGTGPMDAAGTTNTTNQFQLPVNSSWQPLGSGSAYCDNSMPWQYIVAITLGCVGSFLLGAIVTWLALRLRQKKKAAGAGFEQVDQRPASGGEGSS